MGFEEKQFCLNSISSPCTDETARTRYCHLKKEKEFHKIYLATNGIAKLFCLYKQLIQFCQLLSNVENSKGYLATVFLSGKASSYEWVGREFNLKFFCRVVSK